MRLLLDLKKHCVQTEIRRQYEKDMAAYFRADAVQRKQLERRLILLEAALKTLDFARLRSENPVLAGGSSAVVFLKQEKSGPAVIVSNDKADPYDHNLPACRFCMDRIKSQITAEYGSVWAVEDRYPVTQGHHLIIPKRHTRDWFSMTDEERRHAEELIIILKNRLSEADETITGFNIGMNCGASAGQTIFHAHIHLIPRRNGDTQDPTGGVRGVIPDKMSYLSD
jgi:diadenosine tetraphosphate (Ap4A) HIT family hydrolase